MKRTLLSGPAALLVVGATALTVFVYNTWSYCCGRCTVGTFLTLGPFGWTLLALNALAAVLLIALRIRRRMRYVNLRCRCGTPRDESWSFCPDCGESVSPKTP